MSNIRKVAHAAGVSVATVSRALSSPEKVSEKNLKRVKEAIEKLKYRPNMLARNFRSTRAYSLLVLTPDITNQLFAQVIRAIEDRAQHRDYGVLLGDTGSSKTREQDYVKMVETRLADGLIQLRPDSLITPEEYDHVACVNACGSEETSKPTVRIDNVSAFKTVVDYLISIGHRRIGVITGLKENAHTKDRFEGYLQGLKQANIEYDETLLAEGDFTMWSGINAASYFCSLKKRPTAICCMSDEMAFGVMQTLKANGIRVPEDISVSGFDDIPYAKHLDPALTTISQPWEEMGKVAVDTLLHIVEEETLTQSEFILPYEFIIRKSTAKIAS